MSKKITFWNVDYLDLEIHVEFHFGFDLPLQIPGKL